MWTRQYVYACEATMTSAMMTITIRRFRSGGDEARARPRVESFGWNRIHVSVPRLELAGKMKPRVQYYESR